MRTLAIVVAALLLGGCDELNVDGTNDTILDAVVMVRTVRGHDYVIFRTGHGCVAALHAASCPCMKGGKHEEEVSE